LLLKLEQVPLLLGFILGKPLEENFRRSLVLARGDIGVFLERPVSAAALGVTVLLLSFSFWSYWRGKLKKTAIV